MSVLTIPIAVLLDYVLGESKRFHPLVGFGKIGNVIESKLNAHANTIPNKLMGCLCWALLTLPIPVLFLTISSISGFWLVSAFTLYLSIGYNSLLAHVRPIQTALSDNNLPAARKSLSMIVSRDTEKLDAPSIRKAAIESILENGNDAIFAPIFWCAVGGAPAVIIHRLTNTLDAMWGYKTKRYYSFGWCAAKVDDSLNYIPARLVALSYAMLGNFKLAFQGYANQAKDCDSPNAGPVMCAGAGTLNIILGGNTSYHGKIKRKATMGYGPEPTDTDIDRTIKLITKTLILWCVISFFIQLVFSLKIF